MEKVKVVQEWVEDLDSKNGWVGSGWMFEDGFDVPENFEVQITDFNKFYNPIEGYILIDNESGDPMLRQFESLDEIKQAGAAAGRRMRVFFGQDGTKYPEDDGERDLLEGEFEAKVRRVSGEMICSECGLPYWKHEDEMRVLGIEDRPFVKRLCDGTLAKI